MSVQKDALSAAAVIHAVDALADPERAASLQRFFRTGPGGYGEGDRFAGVTMPQIRGVVRRFRALPPGDVWPLLDSPVHEHRMAGLLVLVERYRHGGEDVRSEVYDIYMRALAAGRIDNWDLVDVTAPDVVGAHLRNRSRGPLFALAASPRLWDRRVAIVATFAFIRSGDASTTLALAERLLDDRHDLIHKAAGWMLREVGKRVDERLLRDFLDAHAAGMPRTMLRSAVERLDADARAAYMRRGGRYGRPAATPG